MVFCDRRPNGLRQIVTKRSSCAAVPGEHGAIATSRTGKVRRKDRAVGTQTRLCLEMSRQQISDLNVTFIWSLLTSPPLFSVEDISWGLWIAESMERGGVWIERNSTTLFWWFLGVFGWYNVIDMGHVVDSVISTLGLEDLLPRLLGVPLAERPQLSSLYRICFCWEETQPRSDSNNDWSTWDIKKCWPSLLDSGQLWRIVPALQLLRELVKPPRRLHWCSASPFV